MCQSKRQLKFFNAIGEIFVSNFTTSSKGLNNQLYLDNTKCEAIELLSLIRLQWIPKTYFSVCFILFIALKQKNIVFDPIIIASKTLDFL